MTVRSAGLLLYRRTGAAPNGVEVLLAHMGGPYWQRKDAAAWSIPKGEYAEDEEPLGAARREFAEELGLAPPEAEYVPLGEVTQRAGKIVTAWAVEADVDVRNVVSNTFEIEWPPRSGRRRKFPEVDRADWFGIPVARLKIVQGQLPLLDRLTEQLSR